MQWIKQHQLWSALIGIVSLIVLIGGGIWGWAQYQAHEMTTEYVQMQNDWDVRVIGNYKGS